MNIKLRLGGLFSGIGGFELAGERMGWENVFHCELNGFGRRVLKYYWPNAESFEDIKKTDFRKYANKIDVLTGGFPCQPYSNAGKRLGTEDDRHLWPEMLRAVKEISPRYIVGENVPGIITWNKGLVFKEVQADLEAEGYEVFPVVLPACSIGAPHRRDRVWFVAHSNKSPTQPSGESKRLTGEGRKNNDEPQKRRKQAQQYFGCSNVSWADTNAKCKRQQRQRRTEKQLREKTFGNWETNWVNANGGWPTQSPICGRNDGLSSRLDGITLREFREESIKAYGNAIVPQLAYEIFKVINEYEILMYHDRK
jgi:DNA (cytosine-5)-methyltransferase 1